MVVGLHPLFQGCNKFHRALPLANPYKFLFERPHQPFGVRIAFRIVIAGKRLRDAQGPTGLHKGDGGGLTEVAPVF